MNCKEATAAITHQIVDLLDRLDNTNYAKPLAVFNGSSLGKHFRHILDFYYCMLKFEKEGTVDYAKRKRDPEVEVDTQAAKVAFQHVLESIADLDEELAITVKADFSVSEEESRPVVYSTVGREMMFAFDHAVHHLAIIKIGLRVAFPEFEVDENLGIAPSTLKHHSGSKAGNR